MKRARIYVLIWLFVIGTAYVPTILAAETRIIVHYKNVRSVINDCIYGINVLGVNDPNFMRSVHREYHSYPDYGGGLWDPKYKEPVGFPLQCLKNMGVKCLRFPGGGGSQEYHWRDGVGERGHFLFGINEFLTVCKHLSAEPVFTVNCLSERAEDAAALVSYLKSSYSLPKLKYFEIGNEVYNSLFTQGFRDAKERAIAIQVGVNAYAAKYLDFYRAMKEADPTILIGGVLYNTEWDDPLLRIIKDQIDFGIIHWFPTPIIHMKRVNARELFYSLLERIYYDYEVALEQKQWHFERILGRKLPIAITEYNGGLFDDTDTFYRHSLGNALVNAELLRIFMKPESNVIFANYWNFINEHWSAISNGFNFKEYRSLFKLYRKRPNYYVFELYRAHFGATLIDAQIVCPAITNAGRDIPVLSINASRSMDGSKVYLMVVNKNLEKSETATIDLRDFVPAVEPNAWVLNGPSIDATNERRHNNVKVNHRSFKVNGNPFEYTFEPHSLTALEFDRKS